MKLIGRRIFSKAGTVVEKFGEYPNYGHMFDGAKYMKRVILPENSKLRALGVDRFELCIPPKNEPSKHKLLWMVGVNNKLMMNGSSKNGYQFVKDMIEHLKFLDESGFKIVAK